MARPCKEDHDLSPGTCRLCFWCCDDSDTGRQYRDMWDEGIRPLNAGVDNGEVDSELSKSGSQTSDFQARRMSRAAFRLAICASCEHFDPGEVSCRVCDCRLTNKAQRAAPSCPEYKWPVAAPSPGEVVPGIDDPLSRQDMTRLPSGWQHQPRNKTVYGNALRQILYGPVPSLPRSGGDGIVIVGGGSYWPMIAIAVRMIRLASVLPIQIWHDGAREPVNAAQVESFPRVYLRNLDNLAWPLRRRGGWENKTTAILASGFETVLYLDADAYLVGDPGPLFRSAKVNRFVCWADLPWNNTTVQWDWTSVANANGVVPIQGGQLCMHVPSFARELTLAHWINQHSDYFYHHQYGDQDSWRIALAATGGQHHVLGNARWQHPAFVCEWDKPIVVHRCQGKLWGNGPGIFNHDLPGERQMREAYNDVVIGSGDAAAVFSRIYQTGQWGPDAASGAGATPQEAAPYLDTIKSLAAMNGWDSAVDLGSGDGRITLVLPFETLSAVDVYQPHIDHLKRVAEEVPSHCLDLDVDRDKLPSAQVALMKDVMHHWPNALVVDWINWAKSSGKWEWLIVTSDCHQRHDGEDTRLGGYRALNPGMKPLLGLGGNLVCQYLHKAIVAFDCRPAVTRRPRPAKGAAK